MKKYKDDLWDVSEIPSGTILRDWFDEGVRILVMRGPASMNVYLGIPKDHPLAGFDYDDLNVNCHGGLTFGSEGGKYWPKGYFWYGYDYAHLGDFTIFEEKGARDIQAEYDHSEDKKWTLREIVDDSWEAICDFKRLMKLAEKIKEKK
jgi:hypothetical protein